MSGHSTRWLFQSTHSSWNTEIWNVGFCRGRESRRPREKTLGVRTRTKPTQPTLDTRSWNQTWATVMGGDCSHHRVNANIMLTMSP